MNGCEAREQAAATQKKIAQRLEALHAHLSETTDRQAKN